MPWTAQLLRSRHVIALAAAGLLVHGGIQSRKQHTEFNGLCESLHALMGIRSKNTAPLSPLGDPSGFYHTAAGVEPLFA
jgi:hypothetical protein